MLTSSNRIAAIEAAEPTGEMKSINYQNDLTPRPVKRIPLKYLLYNPFNGRIRSLTKSYESQFGELDPSDPEDAKTIEQFLYDSARSRNDKTLESLEINGQQEVGIVTKDGVIIDGNRRAMLLSVLSRKNKHEGYFKAVVLPSELHKEQKEIVTLETSYQMGVDSKVDYNPIEKYIRCKELNTLHGLSVADIANVMAEEDSKVNEWLSIFDLMEEYLAFYGTPGLYTRLEKREGHFVDLNQYLRSYTNKHVQALDWKFDPDDITALKHAYFTYIRLGVPVAKARSIARPTSGGSFFCKKDIWAEFQVEREQALADYHEESFKVMKERHPERSNEDVIRLMDSNWRDHVEIHLMENLSYAEGLLKDSIERQNPIKILKRTLNSLGQIDEERLPDNADQAKRLIEAIDDKLRGLRKVLDR